MPDITASASPDMQDCVSFDPDKVNEDWVLNVTQLLLSATERGTKAAQEVLPHTTTQLILEALYEHVRKEPTVVDVVPSTPGAAVVVVGDTHGQLHDVCSMLRKVGQPSEQQHFVFNGDFVDRGAWGLEVLIVLACWKLVYPAQVTILRGNHECTTCTHMYGFRGEVLAKYGPKDFKDVFKVCKKLFAALPLAAVVGGQTLVLHGGLFRKPNQSTHKRKKRRKTLPGSTLEVGSLEDLRAAGKGGLDPNGAGKSVIATDVLWSDPSNQPGLMENAARGVGLLFGPDITQAFLEANKLKLIIRSHEGPDARWKREGMKDMDKGHSLDHITPEGNLMTVFSAPDYPQFQPANEDRFNNQGAVAMLRSSHDSFTTPEIVEYSAVPRPEAQAFYMYEDVPDSDEELSIGHGSPSDLSAASSQAGSHASSADMSSAEVASTPSPDDEDEASPAANSNGAASNQPDTHAAGEQPAAAANGHDKGSLSAVGSEPGVQSLPIPGSLGASKQLEAHIPHGSSRSGHIRRGAYGTGPECKGTSAADQRQHLSEPQLPMRPGLASNDAAVMPGVPSVPLQVSASELSQAGGVSEEHCNRNAATVFDQGIADQAEAADLDAGIAACIADDVDVSASMPANTSPRDAYNNPGRVSADMSDLDDTQLSFTTRQTRRSQPRPAPWR